MRRKGRDVELVDVVVLFVRRIVEHVQRRIERHVERIVERRVVVRIDLELVR